jgi:hypothetical protein
MENKTYNLYLDDIRIPFDSVKYTKNTIYKDVNWVIVRSYYEFVRYITKNGLPKIISFDHDLADEHYSNDMYKGTEVYNKNYEKFQEKTGYDAVKWLVDYCIDNNLKFPEWYLHTMNPAGMENMKSYILNYLKHSTNDTQE